MIIDSKTWLIQSCVGLSDLKIRCPSQSEWIYRTLWVCNGTETEKYTCLYNAIKLNYEESCKFPPTISGNGVQYVVNLYPNTEPCRHDDRYQPFSLGSNVSSACVFYKSKCSEDGQVLFRRGSHTDDLTCRCDFEQGFGFVNEMSNQCDCIPSIEDCSCYVKRTQCKPGQKFIADYKCLHEDNNSHINTCPPMGPVSSRKDTPPLREISEKELDNIDPHNLKVTVEGDSLRISWSVSDNELTNDIQKYKIFYTCSNSWNGTRPIVVEHKKYYLLNQLLPTKTYRFKVSVCFRNGIESKFSEEETFNTELPAQPRSLHVYGENQKIVLLWEAPANNLIGIENYLLTISTDNWITSEKILLDCNTLKYEKLDAKEDEDYRFEIVSCSNSVNSKPLNIIFPTRHDAYRAAVTYDRDNLQEHMKKIVHEEVLKEVNKTLNGLSGTYKVINSVQSEGSIVVEFTFIYEGYNDVKVLHETLKNALQKGVIGPWTVQFKKFWLKRLNNPSPPKKVETLSVNNGLLVSWKEPSCTFFKTKEYLVEYTRNDWQSKEEIIVPVDTHSCLITQELTSAKFQVKVYTCICHFIRSSPSLEVSQVVEGVFKRPLMNMTIMEGLKASFECEVEKPYRGEWYKDGKQIKSSSAIAIDTIQDRVHKLTILHTTIKDKGKYEIKINNIMSAADLDVKGLFKRPLMNMTIMEGLKASFECEVEKPYRGEWYKDGKQIKSSSAIAIDTIQDRVHKLTILHTTIKDKGKYEIKINNIISGADLDVKGLFKRALINMTIMEGLKASFECEVEKSYPGKWFKDGKQIKSTSAIAIDTIQDRVHKLTILHTTIKDKGKYEIKINNIISGADLDVKGLFKRPLMSMTIMEGLKASFECEVEKPYPGEWYKDGRQIQSSSNIVIDTIQDRVHKLTILQTTIKDKGKYDIEINNIISGADLDVKGLFKRPLMNMTIMEGLKASFECEVEKPYPGEWYKDGKQIKSSSTIAIDTIQDRVHKLTILQTTIKDKGKYEIKINNIMSAADLDVKVGITQVKCHYCEKLPVNRCYECSTVLCDDCYHKHDELTYAQCRHTFQSFNDELQLNNTFKVSSMIVDMKALPGGILVIALRSREMLLTRFVSDKQQNEIQIGGLPYSIAIVDRSTVVVLLTNTYEKVDSIEIVDVTQKQVIQHIDIPLIDFSPPFLLCPLFYIDDELYINSRSGITVMDMSMTRDREIHLGFTPIDMCYDSKAARIHCIDEPEKHLICIERNGKTVFSFKDLSLTDMKRLTIDGEGNVLILCHKKCDFTKFKVHRISRDGKSSDVIIRSKLNNGFSAYKFSSICFHEELDSVVIGFMDKVLVYKND
ncbi:TTN [Mytilus coruscus]|uniref:TTN n=1 Tax=Mytilus coruscus TaxID=42192 RepID=A0A6J8AWC9_MYTCO|nr:TTN [Mytilus coruscus]